MKNIYIFWFMCYHFGICDTREPCRANFECVQDRAAIRRYRLPIVIRNHSNTDRT